MTPATQRRNTPNQRHRFSLLVDYCQEVEDDARYAGLFGIADELMTIRTQIVALALRVWRGEGGEQR